MASSSVAHTHSTQQRPTRPCSFPSRPPAPAEAEGEPSGTDGGAGGTHRVECGSCHVVRRKAPGEGSGDLVPVQSLPLGLSVTFPSFICEIKGLN